ncbi:MAG: hypothetical protein ACOVRN_10675 [Flavobacterium sp.]
MKKILLLFASVGLLTLSSCTVEDNSNQPDNDTIAEVFAVTGVNFIPDSQGNTSITVPLNPAIYNSDMVLVYRNAGYNGANPIWEPIPTSYNLAEGSLQYYFDFSINEVVIYLYTDFNPSFRPDFTRNQTFRVVVVPGYLSNKSSKALDTSDYNAVIAKYGIKESDIKQVKL